MDLLEGRQKTSPRLLPPRLSPASLSLALASSPSSPLLLPSFLAISRSRSLSLIPILFPLFCPFHSYILPALSLGCPLRQSRFLVTSHLSTQADHFLWPFASLWTRPLRYSSIRAIFSAQLASSTPSPDDPPSCAGLHTCSRIHTPLLGPRSYSRDSLRLLVNPDRAFTRGAPFCRDIAAVQGGIVSVG